MKSFKVSNLTYSNILYLHSERESFQLDPEYQRQSDIWPLEKRQLLVDSIINGYDVPKIYFHKFPVPRLIEGQECSHAIIDGKQRLSSIWGFIDGDFALSSDIEYLSDSDVDLRGMTYAELGKKYPKLKLRFDSYQLSVVEIDTADLDLIEDMFSRLNEAVPLSAAEKRNAFGGPVPVVIRRVARARFFTRNLPFSNKRYRHFDLAAKFLLVEHRDSVVDTKKVYLDEFVRGGRKWKKTSADKLARSATQVLEAMGDRFTASDKLLRSVGMVTLYYHVFRMAIDGGWLGEVTRKKFEDFERKRKNNRELAEVDISKAAYDLLEFDRYTQTPNDSYAIQVRLSILLKHVFGRELTDAGE